MRVIKLCSVHSIYSKRMLAKYMRRMRINNLEIRIAGSSCRPQLVSRKMLRPILGVLFLSLVVTFCMLCLINILSLNCFCAIKHILIYSSIIVILSLLQCFPWNTQLSAKVRKSYLHHSALGVFFDVNKAGTSHSYDDCDSWLLSQENRGKVEPKKSLAVCFPAYLWYLSGNLTSW